MHRIDFELTSDVTQEDLRVRLSEQMPDVQWRGRESEYMGVYTMARFENQAVAKIFQPNGESVFEIEIAAPKDVKDEWLTELRCRILAAFEQPVHQ